MKVIEPDPMLREAADVLAHVRGDVVVIDASAVRVALDGHDVAITPTRDIDAGPDSGHCPARANRLARTASGVLFSRSGQ